MSDQYLISIPRAARRLDISPQTFRRHMTEWGLQPVRLGRRVLLRADDVVDLVSRRAQGGKRDA